MAAVSEGTLQLRDSQLNSTTRRLLAAWRVGTSKRVDEILKTYFGETHSVGGYFRHLRQLDYAIMGGWLTERGERDSRNRLRNEQRLVRLSRPCSVYKPKGGRPDYVQATGSSWPWSVDEHWRRVDESPIHKVRNAAEYLGKVRKSELHWSYPVCVDTKAKLDTVRKQLEQLFRGRALHYVCRALERVETRDNLESLLCELLVVPEHDAGRGFTRFAPRDPHEAFATRAALRDGATTFLDLYWCSHAKK